MPSPASPEDEAVAPMLAVGQSLHLLAAEPHSSRALASVCGSCPRKEAEICRRKQSKALVCVVFPPRLSPSGHTGAQHLSPASQGLFW